MQEDEQDFYTEKQRYQAEAQAARKEAAELRAKMRDMLIDNALKQAFTESGGRWDAAEGEGVSSFDVVKACLKNRIELRGKQIVFKDSHGNIEIDSEGLPKTDYQKRLELKQSESFRPFFLGADNSSNGSTEPQQQQTQTGRPSYTHEEARRGKATINDIASGKADIW